MTFPFFQYFSVSYASPPSSLSPQGASYVKFELDDINFVFIVPLCWPQKEDLNAVQHNKRKTVVFDGIWFSLCYETK
jgi:hypothetical protein